MRDKYTIRKTYNPHYTHSGPCVAIGSSLAVIDCRECGFAHLDPLPDPATVARYYEDDQFYSQHSPPGWFVKERQEYDAHLWHPYFAYLARQFGGWLPVIDYGCGAGWFVDYLDWRGRTVWGIEPSRAAREFSPVKNRLLESKLLLNRTGNVSLLLTLEHVPDPERFLREDVLPFLHPKGRLIVSVPNEFNPLQRLAGLKRPKLRHWFVSPVHCNYFDAHSLDRLLERVGLKVVTRSATFPMELWLLLGRDHRGNDDLGKRNHLARLRFERRMGAGAFEWYGRLHRLFGIGRELVRVAEWA